MTQHEKLKAIPKPINSVREEVGSRIYANFPAELKVLPQFVTWRYEYVGQRRTKVLFNPTTGLRASSTEAESWSPFLRALAAYLYFPYYDGIGFVFSEDDPYCGIDLDHCVNNGNLNTEARGILKEISSYSELSPSGHGVHIIARAKLPPGRRRKDWIEMYDQGRYFTITGNHIKKTPIEVIGRGREIARLHTRIFPKQSGRTNMQEPAVLTRLGISEDQALASIYASYDGHKFKCLWQGHWELLKYESQSEADLALTSLLVKWFGNRAELVDELFRKSGMFREKWDEKRGQLTYGELTINKALGVCV